MRTFIIRARKGATQANRIKSSIGTKNHIEVVAHSVMNAFFISNGFRPDVDVYIVLDSSDNFPRTLKLSSQEGLSITGFHESAVLDLIENALKEAALIQKDKTITLSPGLEIHGYGFEKLTAELLNTHTLYLLEPKGEDIRTAEIAPNPVFILSDHLALPKNIIKSLKRRGANTLGLGPKMLFASQCIVLINHELDRGSSHL